MINIMSNPPEDQILFAIGHLADSFARVEFAVINILSSLERIQKLEKL